MLARTVLSILVVITVAQSLRAQPAEVSRVLGTFDFEERRLGNVEDLPMHWTKVLGAGLPHYVNGALSADRQRGGRYSFKMTLDGGSVIYRYQSGYLKVQRDARYHVETFVQTTPLQHARARLSAYFTDIDGHAIEGSVRNSRLFADDKPNETEWTALSVELAADDPKAAFLVIELGLLQPAQYSEPRLGQRTLYPQDIRGAAWFDDVSVWQVPQVTLSSERPGNIFRRGDARRLSVLVNDRFTDDLAAQLVVRDAEDRIVYQKSGALDMSAAETLGPGQKRMSLTLPGELPPGWYAASLEMMSKGRFVGKHTLDLILLADEDKRMKPDARFGLIATDLPVEGWSELPEILPILSVGRVKLGVWSEQGDAQQIDPAGFDRLLERLQEKQITPTACLLTLPPAVREKMRGELPLRPDSSFDTGAALAAAAEDPWLQILKSPSDEWQSQLAYLVARHANRLDRWQLGADGIDDFVTERRMREVYRRVYAQFATLVAKPDLAMPWPAWYELDGEMPATVALHVKPDILPSQLPLYMADIARGASSGTNMPSLSVYLQPLSREQYGREMQIRDLAQRILYTLTADAKRIDIKLPFTVTRDHDTVSKQPEELFIIVRTIIRTLANARFVGKVPIAENVEAFLFERNGEGILMLWDRGSAAGVKQLAINLGSRAARMDLWGNVTPLIASNSSSDRTSLPLELGPMPIFLVGIDAQLAQLRASIAFDNNRIESSFKPHTRRIRFTNPYRVGISGNLKLTPPKGWTINPPSQSFTLNSGETFDREVTIEFPYNSFAGAKTISADFQIQGENNERFTVPLVLNLGLSDIGLQTIALRDGNDVIVQQMITNYSDKPIDYNAFAMCTGQARQEKLVTGLAPGRTTIKKYRFTNVKLTAESKVRSGVKELIGTRVLNDEVGIQ